MSHNKRISLTPCKRKRTDPNAHNPTPQRAACPHCHLVVRLLTVDILRNARQNQIDGFLGARYPKRRRAGIAAQPPVHVRLSGAVLSASHTDRGLSTCQPCLARLNAIHRKSSPLDFVLEGWVEHQIKSDSSRAPQFAPQHRNRHVRRRLSAE